MEDNISKHPRKIGCEGQDQIQMIHRVSNGELCCERINEPWSSIKMGNSLLAERLSRGVGLLDNFSG